MILTPPPPLKKGTNNAGSSVHAGTCVYQSAYSVCARADKDVVCQSLKNTTTLSPEPVQSLKNKVTLNPASVIVVEVLEVLHSKRGIRKPFLVWVLN